ncbi:MAG: hypothetical protein ACFE9N_17055 [Promethearchaeota archaeon]
MNTKEFINQLNEIQKLMNLEKYKEAIILIEHLKELEKKGNFDYNLTHRLFQLDSNSRSLYNQQLILRVIKDISINYDSISLPELNQILTAEKNLNLKLDILRREIELLILRNLLPFKIENDILIMVKL